MELRPYQQEASDVLWNALCTEPGNKLVVAPTGSGKSLLIADLAKRVFSYGGRSLILCAQAELIEQNTDKIRQLAPTLRVGQYCAGLKKRQTDADVIVASIQSVAGKAHEFIAHCGMVDEAHLVNTKDAGRFRDFIADAQKYNPSLKFSGFTATPFRLGYGLLTDGKDTIWDSIAHEIPVKDLMFHDPPYLSKIVVPTDDMILGQIDISHLKTVGAEYAIQDLENEAMIKVKAACREIVDHAQDRRSVLIFCVTIAHATAVTQELKALVGDDQVQMVEEGTPALFRRVMFQNYRQYRYKYLVNVNVLTTGFDAPNIDCIGILRSTKSAGLFAQMVGRGFRLCDGKQDCLLLDFGSNLRTHGPLDSPTYGREREKTERTKARRNELDEDFSKACPNCGKICEMEDTYCTNCGQVFAMPRKINHDEVADKTSSVFVSDAAEVYSVETVHMHKHTSRSTGIPTLRITYECDLHKRISEWVCLEHDRWSRAGKNAVKWWAQHCRSHPPDTVDMALMYWQAHAMRTPVQVKIVRDGKYDRIIDRNFQEDRPLDWGELEEVDLFSFDDIPF